MGTNMYDFLYKVNMGNEVSDELLAAFIDGSSLDDNEQLLIGEALSDVNLTEVLDIVNDINDNSLVFYESNVSDSIFFNYFGNNGDIDDFNKSDIEIGYVPDELIRFSSSGEQNPIETELNQHDDHLFGDIDVDANETYDY